MSSSSVGTSRSKAYVAGTTSPETCHLLPETSASSALSTCPNSSLIRPSSSEPCERSPDALTCSNCATEAGHCARAAFEGVRRPLHGRCVAFLQSLFYRLKPRACIIQEHAGEIGHNVRLVFTL